MRLIRDKVLQCLYDYSDQDEKLIDELNRIVDDMGVLTCSVILNVLTHLDLPSREAEKCWREIISHRQDMTDLLGRKVNLTTAICDYFCSVHLSLKSPVVVEIRIFENTIRNIKYDKLTGLYTRHFFDDSLQREIGRAKRYETDLSILFLDLDDFKQVNDTFGHLAGDYVLASIAEIIRKQIRSEDIAARYGGEEIILILPETGKIQGLVLSERIREKIEKADFVFEDKKINMTISGGLASLPIDTTNGADLVKYADTAMYRAKAAGKNNVTTFSDNKRRYVRIDFVSEIQFHEISCENIRDIFSARSKNISYSGILFENNFPLILGTNLQLQLSFGNDVMIQILGTVARVEAIAPDCFDIGVCFLDIDKTAENEISRYLQGKVNS
ncbi:MAG: diguanylate cyclase [Thermodesulfobacteriota bacterium]|nr:diguanylate cyclase [Thermodesulfobacteriota bacterium]